MYAGEFWQHVFWWTAAESAFVTLHSKTFAHMLCYHTAFLMYCLIWSLLLSVCDLTADLDQISSFLHSENTPTKSLNAVQCSDSIKSHKAKRRLSNQQTDDHYLEMSDEIIAWDIWQWAMKLQWEIITMTAVIYGRLLTADNGLVSTFNAVACCFTVTLPVWKIGFHSNCLCRFCFKFWSGSRVQKWAICCCRKSSLHLDFTQRFNWNVKERKRQRRWIRREEISSDW